MTIGYQERNHWITVVISVWALIFYFSKVLALEAGLNADLDRFLPFIVKIIIYSTVAGIVLAIVNWSFNKDKHVEKDEMDRMIELKGYRNAYWTFSGFLWTIVIAALLNEHAERSGWDGYGIVTVNLLIHSIFTLGWVSALVQSVTHITLYRKGVA